VTRIAFVTNQPLLASGRQVFSEVASVRRELLLPAKVLQERGHETRLISLATMARLHIREELDQADHIIFGKIFVNPQRDGAEAFSSDAGEYERILAHRRDDQRLYFCLSDDHFEDARFAAFYRSVAPKSRGWIVSSPGIAERLPESPAPVSVYPEPVEMARNEPHVPRRGLRERMAVGLARRAKVGLDPWRLRLLWFGHSTNLPALLAVVPELDQLAEDVPLYLECVTQPGAPLAAKLTDRDTSFSVPLRIAVSPWSLDATRIALERSDAVLLPQLTDSPNRRAKSNNRLIDSVHAGRFAIAHPLPSYMELREYAWVGDTLGEGLRWLLRHPEEALKRLKRGQTYVAQRHSLEAFGQFWQRTLQLA